MLLIKKPNIFLPKARVRILGFHKTIVGYHKVNPGQERDRIEIHRQSVSLWMRAKVAMASFLYLLVVIVTLEIELVRSSPLHQSENARVVGVEEVFSNKPRGKSVDQDDEDEDDEGSAASALLSRAEQALWVKSE